MRERGPQTPAGKDSTPFLLLSISCFHNGIRWSSIRWVVQTAKQKSIHPGRSCVFILRSVVLQHRFKHKFRQRYRCSCLAVHEDACADWVNEAIESWVANVYIGILLLSSFMNIRYGKLVSLNPRIKSQALVIAKGLNLANDLLQGRSWTAPVPITWLYIPTFKFYVSEVLLPRNSGDTHTSKNIHMVCNRLMWESRKPTLFESVTV